MDGDFTRYVEEVIRAHTTDELLVGELRVWIYEHPYYRIAKGQHIQGASEQIVKQLIEAAVQKSGLI